MNTVEILKEARRLLVEKGWTQDAFARDAEGAWAVGWGSLPSEAAVCFCGWGALLQVAAGYVNAEPAKKALDAAACVKHFPDFNDKPGRTVEEVLAVFDKAIAAQEALAA